MGSVNGNGGGGDVDASTDPFGKETMSKSYQDRESVPDRDTSLDTKNIKGTPYSPELAEAVKELEPDETVDILQNFTEVNI